MTRPSQACKESAPKRARVARSWIAKRAGATTSLSTVLWVGAIMLEACASGGGPVVHHRGGSGPARFVARSDVQPVDRNSRRGMCLLTVARIQEYRLSERLATLDTLSRARSVNREPVEQRSEDGPNGYVSSVARRDALDGSLKRRIIAREQTNTLEQLAAVRRHYDDAVSRCRRWLSDAQLECIARQPAAELVVDDAQQHCMPDQLYEAVFVPAKLRSAAVIGTGSSTVPPVVARSGRGATRRARMNRERGMLRPKKRARKEERGEKREGWNRPVSSEDTKSLARDSAASLQTRDAGSEGGSQHGGGKPTAQKPPARQRDGRGS